MTLRAIFSLTAAAVVAACATEAGAQSDETMSEADRTLAQYERTGETRNCINVRRIDRIDPLDDERWLVHIRGGDVYLTDVGSGCNNAASSFTYISYTLNTSSLCRGEIVRVLDRGADTVVGSCGIGEFEKLERKAEES